METRRFVNQSQPQTLVFATFLLYFGAVFVLLGNSPHVGPAFGSAGNIDLLENLGRLFVAVGGVYAAYQIAQEKKIGYFLAIAVGALPLVAKLVFCFRYQVSPLKLDLVEWLFDIALFALIVHTQSRDYVRLWFK